MEARTESSAVVVPEFVYHGSREDIRAQIMTFQADAVDGEEAVFAAIHKYVALMFAGNRWNDRSIKFGCDDGRWYAVENIPGAFEQAFKGCTGYIYKLSGASFHDDARLGLAGEELISNESVKIIEKEVISDVWEALKASPIRFIGHEEYMEFIRRAILDADYREMALKAGLTPRGPDALERSLLV